MPGQAQAVKVLLSKGRRIVSRVTQRLHEVEMAKEKKKGLHAEACNPLILILNSGAADRNRTGDLRITNALLYRLSYSGSTTGDPDEEPYSSKQPAKLASPTLQFLAEGPK